MPKVTSGSEPSSDRPRGRDEVVQALLAAATRLFTERGPAAVSIREVAREAKVNVGLVHRHIGGKDDLLSAVLRSRPTLAEFDHLLDGSLEALVLDMVRPRPDREQYARLQARTILDGFDLPALQGQFPLIDHGVRVLRTRLPEGDADARGALLAAMVLGWGVFGPTLLEILGLVDQPPDAFTARVRPAIEAFLATPPEPPAGPV